MKSKRILLIFVVILLIIFCVDCFGHNRKIVILSGKLSKVECDVKEYNESQYVSAKGTGVITFFDPSTEKFAAVGHSLKNDLEDIHGSIYYSSVSNLVKSENGNVGNLYSNEDSTFIVGNVEKNTEFGVYGSCSIQSELNNEIEILNKNKLKKGKAILYIDFGDNSKKEYEIEVVDIILEDNGMFSIKIIDEELLAKTGGIVKGMSGSPIIQDGKLVGALTKVTKDDVTFGYGIFAETMLKECKNI